MSQQNALDDPYVQAAGTGIDKGSGDDNRDITQAPSSSGGEGGLFGNASAAIGDVGIGVGSASADGDNTFNFGDTFFGDGPTINDGLSGWQIAAGAAIGLIGLKFLKG